MSIQIEGAETVIPFWSTAIRASVTLKNGQQYQLLAREGPGLRWTWEIWNNSCLRENGDASTIGGARAAAWRRMRKRAAQQLALEVRK